MVIVDFSYKTRYVFCMDKGSVKKGKLTINEIIENIKSKGITFNHISEESAKDYLLTHTYYFKLKAYAKNYKKNPTRNKYIQLDFSYLQDLARLDMYFRELIFKMTVDVEYLVKVQIMTECQKNTYDDGYKIVSDFLNENSAVKEDLQKRTLGKSYNSALIKDHLADMPIWVFLETINLYNLSKFYAFYTTRFPIENDVLPYLWSIRMLRNASAHNLCVLNRLLETGQTINSRLFKVIKRDFPVIGARKLKQYMANPVVYDFLAVLTAFKDLDKSKCVLKRHLVDLHHFLKRCTKHASYYRGNNAIRGVFRFICSFVREYEKSIGN